MGVFPEQPGGFEGDGAAAGVEAAGGGVGGIDVDADAEGALVDEPEADFCDEAGAEAEAAGLGADVEPLQFAVAAEAAGEMAGDEAGCGAIVFRDDDGAGRAGDCEVVGDAAGPVGFGLPLGGADEGEGGDVGGLRGSEGDCHGGCLSGQGAREKAGWGETWPWGDWPWNGRARQNWGTTPSKERPGEWVKPKRE